MKTSPKVSTANLEYETFVIERGGQATYHGPGQLVLYPIIDLTFFEKDINAYLRGLEQVVINTAAEFGVQAHRVEGLTGVWVGDEKISAIGKLVTSSNSEIVNLKKFNFSGIKLRRWVAMHGLSLNVSPDLRYFDNIVPCGIKNKSIGSLSSMNPKATINSVSNVLLREFADVFNIQYATCGGREESGENNGNQDYIGSPESAESFDRYLDSFVVTEDSL